MQKFLCNDLQSLEHKINNFFKTRFFLLIGLQQLLGNYRSLNYLNYMFKKVGNNKNFGN